MIREQIQGQQITIAAGNKKIPILMYHSISAQATPKFKPFAIPPAQFADQMAYLHQHGYTPITATDLVQARRPGESMLPERPVVITFDDGMEDFLTGALPILQRYHFAATLYVTTAFVNNTSRWLQHEGEANRPMLTWDQLRKISASGIECGAHSHSHPQLDILPHTKALEEIVHSKQLLEEQLGKEVTSFAYPYGYYTKMTRHLIRESGYSSACAVKHAMSTESSDPFALPRLMVTPDMPQESFAALLTGRPSSVATTLMTLGARTRTPVWQIVRRSMTSVTRYVQGWSKNENTMQGSQGSRPGMSRQISPIPAREPVARWNPAFDDITTTLNVSVIICAYTEERWDDLVAAIDSIRRQTALPREIIVVVDHNTQLLQHVWTEIPDVIAIENTEQQGLSGARNSGIAMARGALIAYLDDDATAEPDWLVQLSQQCANPNVLGVGGVVDPLWSGTRPAWFPHEFSWVVGCSYQELPKQPIVVRNPYGGCTCFRREIFEVVGGFRSSIGRIGTRPMGGEETELCIRAKQHWPQKVFLFEPQAKIHHRVAARRATWKYFFSRCYAEGLSKAVITQYVGAKDGLASERTYMLRTLPYGILRGLRDGLLRFDPAGFLRAGAIVAGLLVTSTGYVAGIISQYPLFSVKEKS